MREEEEEENVETCGRYHPWSQKILEQFDLLVGRSVSCFASLHSTSPLSYRFAHTTGRSVESQIVIRLRMAKGQTIQDLNTLSTCAATFGSKKPSA